MGMEPSGRELLVVVVKGTFHLPKSGEEVRLHEQQVPLIMADTFTGDPGFSAPYYVSIFSQWRVGVGERDAIQPCSLAQ